MTSDNTNNQIDKKNILVVEDDEFLQGMVCQKLEQKGFSVFVANDAQSAEKQVSEQKLDFILLDLVLPKIKGLDFLKELKAEGSAHKDIPVMVLSNLYQDDMIKEAKESGAVDFMVKSNHIPSEIAERITQILANENKS